MRLIKYEFSKVIGMRIPVVVTLILLVFNAALCYYQTSSFDPGYVRDASRYFEEHKGEEMPETSDPADFLSPEEMPYSVRMREEFHAFSDYISSYTDKINHIKDQAAVYISELSARGVPQDSYIMRYQRQVIGIYDRVQKSVRMDFEYVRGWDSYFSCHAVNIYIFVSVLLFTVGIFTQEKTSGMHAVIHPAKNGGIPTITAKITTAILTATLIFLLFSFETWWIAGIRTGYSSAGNCIQVLERFLFCPYPLKIWEYLLLSSGIRLLAFYLFSALVMLVCVLNYNHLISFGAGAGIYGLNLFFHFMNYINADNYLKNLNLINISDADALFERYRTVNFFGKAMECRTAAVSFCLLFILLISAVVIVLYSLNLSRMDIKFRLPRPSFRKTGVSSPKIYCRSLFSHERYKLWIMSGNIVIFLLLITLKLFITVPSDVPSSYADSVYRDYMSVLSGKLTEEKLTYMENERNFINDTFAVYPLRQQEFISGKISPEEYSDYIKDYNYANNRNEYFAEIERHRDYILRLSAEGKDAWFVYDTGWKSLFFAGFDWLFYILLLILFAGLFSPEHDRNSSSGGFVQILKTTKNGRAKTFFAKYRAVLLSVLAVFLIWSALDLYGVASRYELPLTDAPVCSIEALEGFPVGIPIWAFCILYFVVRLIAALSLSTLLFSLSSLFGKIIPVLTLTLCITVLPYLLSLLKFNLFSSLDFTKFMSGTPLLAGGHGSTVFACGFVLLGVLLCVKAGKEWNK